MRRSKQDDTAEGVAVRHLDEIREEDPAARPSRLSALVLASFGGATIVFCALALMRGSTAPPPQAEDPLSALVKQRAASPAPTTEARRLAVKDVTFPQVLSDRAKTTTAMELVRDNKQGDLTLPAAAPDGVL
ncbi:MAG TPA: SPOR domain-containing protein, partial [Sorangium sp.]|nr:SPOR domain-containing protein [Sorangium sp.]